MVSIHNAMVCYDSPYHMGEKAKKPKLFDITQDTTGSQDYMYDFGASYESFCKLSLEGKWAKFFEHMLEAILADKVDPVELADEMIRNLDGFNERTCLAWGMKNERGPRKIKR